MFAAVVLQRSPGVTRAKDIRAAVKQRLTLWLDEKYDSLVDTTEMIAWQNVATRSPTVSDDTAARNFDAKLISGRLSQAVRELTSRAGRGVYYRIPSTSNLACQ